MTWRGCSVKRNTSATIPLMPVNPAQTNIQLGEMVASPENCSRRNRRDSPASANALRPKNQAFLRRNNRSSVGFGGTMCGEELMESDKQDHPGNPRKAGVSTRESRGVQVQPIQ